jgi:hypothetical protein
MAIESPDLACGQLETVIGFTIAGHGACAVLAGAMGWVCFSETNQSWHWRCI